MKRQVITVTMVVLVPEDDEGPKDRWTYFSGFIAGLLQGFSKMVVQSHTATIIDLGNE